MPSVKRNAGQKLWGDSRHETRHLRKLVGYLSKMEDEDRRFIMVMAQQTAKRSCSKESFILLPGSSRLYVSSGEMKKYEVGQTVTVKLFVGRIVEAEIKAIRETTDGLRLQISSGVKRLR